MSISDLLLLHTDLNPEERMLVASYEPMIQSVADLIGGDVFLDCMDRSGEAVVVAPAGPRYALSQYQTSILGQKALETDEPAVYRSFREGMPCHNIIANTQEHQTVSQDVVPVFGASGTVIAVLIAEHDVSREVAMERKLQALSEGWNEPDPADRKTDPSVREAHHRIKNHLQFLSSQCRIKARRSLEPGAASAYLDCAAMTLSISQLHDTLTSTADSGETGDLKLFLQNLLDGFRPFLADQNQEISLVLSCPSMTLSKSRATSIALCVSELIQNAVKYAFPNSESGTVRIEVIPGSESSTVLVSDSGCGAADWSPGMGLRIVQDLVTNRLGGTLTAVSGSSGTKVSFSFLME